MLNNRFGRSCAKNSLGSCLVQPGPDWTSNIRDKKDHNQDTTHQYHLVILFESERIKSVQLENFNATDKITGFYDSTKYTRVINLKIKILTCCLK